MKIILLRKIKSLGDIGEIKEVSAGHAINFLIPQKLAEPASEENISKLKKHKEKAIKEAEQDLALAQANAKKLQGLVVEITAKANSDGSLYSSISVPMIIDKLKAKGIDIDKKQINLIEPIKELGEHSVLVALNHGLEAEITVMVNE